MSYAEPETLMEFINHIGVLIESEIEPMAGKLVHICKRVVSAWDKANRSRGWLSCDSGHDLRCPVARNLPDACECGADELLASMKDLEVFVKNLG